MARDPRKEGSGSKKRGKGSAPGRRNASKRPQKRARKGAADPAKAVGSTRRASRSATLERELNEARARQAATAEILKIIASSPSDAQPVFQAIAERSNRLLNGLSTAVYSLVDGMQHLMAFTPVNAAADAALKSMFPRPLSEALWSEAVLRREIFQIADAETELASRPAMLKVVRLRGWRSNVIVPLVRDRKSIGLISVTRAESGSFGDHHVQLLQTFADQAVIAIENVRLFNETREALARQTASAEVLQVISSSPGDLKPVFDQMLAKAMRLCEAQCGFIYQMEQGAMRAAAESGVPPAFAEYRRNNLHTGGAATPVDLMRATRKPAHVHDARDSEPYRSGNPNAVAGVDLGGARTVLYVPMIRNDDIVGVINVYRREVRPFTDEQIALLENFANQAVVAIENARLFNETKEALAQQTATSEVLSVISSSVADTAPVFEKILDSCEKLFATEQLGIFVVQPDGQTHVGAWRGTAVETVIQSLPRPVEQTATGLVIRSRTVLHIPNTATAQDLPPTVRRVRDEIGGVSMAWAPMLTEGSGIGSIAVMRQPPNPFSEKELSLLKTFADQAVIAIQNTRLFNETREALARQTATSDVLKVIASSPSNLQPVFDAIAERSNQLVGAHSTAVIRYVDGMIELASFTPVNPEADAALRGMFPRRPDLSDPQNEQVLRGEIARIADAESELRLSGMRAVARARGWRSRLLVPLKGDTGVIGWISITRKETGAFAETDVELLQTFADQAVIAIQNVELFEEVQARTRDLQESLQQQTATADVLKVISRSAFDLDSVMNTLARSAAEVCGATRGALWMRDGDRLVAKGIAVDDPTTLDFLIRNPVLINSESHMGRAVLTGTVRNIPDLLNSETNVRKFQQALGFRSLLVVPLMREGRGIGVFTLDRDEVGIFSERQVELVQSFADQAVIAIENTRLFNETKEALERQTATADILSVIASSPDDVQPVFQAIADQSKRLLDGLAVTVYRFVDDMVHLMSFTPVNPAADASLNASYPLPLAASYGAIRAAKGEIFRIIDSEDGSVPERVRNIARNRGWRSAVFVPLLSDGRAIGAISVTRAEPGSFAEHHVEILKTFADQAVIAISNVELFQVVQKRTRELSQSLDNLRAAQDRLVQTEKLASLGQLTAGIAHEIKNPLNFVNNFSALSVDLTDELNDALKQAELAERIRQEVGEITQLLKSNLEKVVQHGKRADSIVKNMLLHSREGSGEQRAADINALVEESLNLAYHGARAEKSGFNITLERAFDAGAGSAELFPQEITRALLNLISNGFYAATRRKADNGDGAFEPTLLASTKDLGGSVEIRIRDNGIGIPPEVKEKMFNPFFTTKPAGEGTGLGLSMTHDIIVKQHGGTIDVATEPGHFTEFIVVLPRANGQQGKTGGQA